MSGRAAVPLRPIVVEVTSRQENIFTVSPEKPKLPVFGHPAVRAVRLILRAATLQRSILRLREDKAHTAKPKMPAEPSALYRYREENGLEEKR